MAGASLLTLLDDIATLLDDISVMTKVAASKTVGVVGDDLALNAEQFAGIRAERELPVVFAVAKGSLINKTILVPAALFISAFIPWAVTPLLMFGGAYLCFEGFEKIAHKFLQGSHDPKRDHDKELEAVADQTVDLVAFEKEKIKGAVRTDLVLSAEIIVIALGAVGGQPFTVQAATVTMIAILITVGVYSLVAAIIKLDDAGLYLVRTAPLGSGNTMMAATGKFLLRLAPLLMKAIALVGTTAMFLVGGGIIAHGLPHALTDLVVESATRLAGEWAGLLTYAALLANIAAGLAAGALLVGLHTLFRPLFARLRGHS